MQLHISPSLRHVTVVTGKGLREFIKVKVGSRRFSYQMVFYSFLFFTLLLRFVFVLSTVDTIDGDPSPFSSLDAREFAQKLKEMLTLMEQRTRTAKIQEYLYRHVASSSIPKQLHCLALKLANEHSINAAARLQLPEAELVPTLVDNDYFHFVLASDNILAASVVAKSLVQNSLRPHKIVL